MTTPTCPYATAPKAEEEPDQNTTAPTESPNPEEALELAKQKCPAFRDTKSGEVKCPFRSAQNAEDLKQMMLSVPHSHYSDASASSSDEEPAMEDAAKVGKSFRLALEHMHTVSKTLHDSAPDEGKGFVLEGGCPFKVYYQANSSEESIPFVEAMENFSLSAIMANMAQDIPQPSSPEAESIAAAASQIAPPAAQEEEDDKGRRLSAALKTGTATSHKAAEDVHFVRNFIRGKIRRDLYAQLVCNLYHVYSALETELDKHGPTHFPSLHQPHELSRTLSLKKDLDYFFPDKDWGPPTPATIDYMHRIQYIAEHDPLLLLSHAYTRYLGDLSGGRVLQRVARRALQLSSSSGLSFYEFEHIPSTKQFKDTYRQNLDALGLSSTQICKMVAEANVAFVLNVRIFEELDVMGGEVEDAEVRALEDALKFFHEEKGLVEKVEGDNKCPFAAMPLPNPHQKKENDQPTPSPATQEPTKGRCPWPFIFFHDPMQGMKDFQTWVVLGLLLSWIYNLTIKSD